MKTTMLAAGAALCLAAALPLQAADWVDVKDPKALRALYSNKTFKGKDYLDRPFVRGDANRDGRVDVSDPVFVLSHLFSGGEGSRCDDAADVDDRGQIDLTDAVGLLNYLFAGTFPPAPPHPEAGLDPTPAGLGCLGF